MVRGILKPDTFSHLIEIYTSEENDLLTHCKKPAVTLCSLCHLSVHEYSVRHEATVAYLRNAEKHYLASETFLFWADTCSLVGR
jgi:hypothetical protein